MLSKISDLTAATDGRYATDQELEFFQTYLKTARLRFSAYQKIQAAETQIVAETLVKLQMLKPDLLTVDSQNLQPRNLQPKWQADTVRVLRYCALALLLDDSPTLKEKMLLWFQTVMQAFSTEKSCHHTYTVMQDVIARYLSAEENQLITPILALTCTTLSPSESATFLKVAAII